MWSAIATIGGALIGADAAGNAAQTQANAANNASAQQLAMYQQNREDMAPWRAAGVNALGRLDNGLAAGGQFTQQFSPSAMYADPGYNFRLDEGRKAIEKSAAARGLLQSGGTLKGIDRYGQDYASNEYTNAFNRFQLDQGNQFNRNAALAGLGQTAVSQLGAQGTQVAGQIGQNMIGAGNANASGYVGAANAINSGISNYQNQQFQNNLLGRLPNYGGGGSQGGYSPDFGSVLGYDLPW